MYSNRFAACIIVDGKIMDELPDGSVAIPLGTEYTIRLFNKHDRRAAAKIFLDTENVSQGGFVVDPHGKVDINRRADRDTAFRFVQLGSSAAKAEGKPTTNEGKEMGLVEVHFYLERERPKYIPPTPIVINPPCPGPHYPPVWPRPRRWDDYYYGGILRDSSGHSEPIGSSASWVGPAAAGSPPDALNSDEHDGSTCMDSMGSSAMSFMDDERSRSTTFDQSSGLRSMNVDPRAGRKRSIAKGASRGACEVGGTPQAKNAAPKTELKDGCTVEGQATGTHFTNVYMDLEPTSTVIKLFLQGYKQPVPVVVAVKERRHHKSKSRR